MAVRLGLGLSHGTPLVVGAAIIAAALPIWFVGFGVIGVALTVVGLTLLLERRRSVPSLPKNS